MSARPGDPPDVDDEEETIDTERAPRGGALQLVILRGGESRAQSLPPRGVVVVGRSSSCDVVIPDATVSRAHAVIDVSDAVSVRHPEGRETVIRVRGRRLEPGERAALAAGEAFEIGAVTVVLRYDAEVLRRQGEARGGVDALDAPVVFPAEMADRVVVRDPATARVYRLALQVARSQIPVLVVGETGAGKELVAETLHRASARARGPFLKVNCAALAATLLESELFGHERGAFSGALRARPGLLEAASGGTLLLDEVGEMSLELQAKLLRAVEDRAVTRVGAVKPVGIDVRFVAATHRDLRAMVAAGTFRADLYYRLNGIALELPPLRARPGDIEPMIDRFARNAGAAAGAGSFSPEALAALRAYGWPGNARELRNCVERALLLAGGARVGVEHLPAEISSVMHVTPRTLPPVSPDASLAPGTDRAGERERILAALAQTHGNQTRAAALLGMPQRTFNKRLIEYKIPGPRGGRT